MKLLGKTLEQVFKNSPKEIADFFRNIFKDQPCELASVVYLLEKEEDYKAIKHADYYWSGDESDNLYNHSGLFDFVNILDDYVAVGIFLTDDGGGDMFFIPKDLINENLKHSMEKS